jgi:hypothetical protein
MKVRGKGCSHLLVHHPQNEVCSREYVVAFLSIAAAEHAAGLKGYSSSVGEAERLFSSGST